MGCAPWCPCAPSARGASMLSAGGVGNCGRPFASSLASGPSTVMPRFGFHGPLFRLCSPAPDRCGGRGEDLKRPGCCGPAWSATRKAWRCVRFWFASCWRLATRRRRASKRKPRCGRGRTTRRGTWCWPPCWPSSNEPKRRSNTPGGRLIWPRATVRAISNSRTCWSSWDATIRRSKFRARGLSLLR